MYVAILLVRQEVLKPVTAFVTLWIIISCLSNKREIFVPTEGQISSLDSPLLLRMQIGRAHV